MQVEAATQHSSANSGVHAPRHLDVARVWIGGVAAGLSMNSPCFQLKQEGQAQMRRKLPLRFKKLPTPVLSGSGSRVFSQPHSLWSTPVSIMQLKHSAPGLANGECRMRNGPIG